MAHISKTFLFCSSLLFCVSSQSADSKSSAAPKSSSDSTVANLQKTFANCAAVSLDEDFQHGTDKWKTSDGLQARWATDKLGLVQPSRLALYEPSLGLTDYELQFLGTIDRGALTWIVRAADFRNYYVVKLVVLKPKPIPKLAIRRYAVIEGKPTHRVETPVVLNDRNDSFYRVSMEIRGDRSVLTIQDQLADSWAEPRLKRGGVGFFSDRGEQSRISSVRIAHHDDLMGRFCAQMAQQ